MQKKIQIVQTLLDALPFIKKFRDEIFVIKYGGSAQTDQKLKEKFAQDILLLYTVGIKPVIVHGGGKRITEILSRLKIDTTFIDGQRVTTAEVMEIVEMVLSGDINKEIVSLLNNHGAKAIGVSGKDAHFITARPKDFEKFGYTGVIDHIDPSVVQNLLQEQFVPVIAPIAASNQLGHPGYNINADLCASKVAGALKAKKIIFLTDTPGVLDKDGKLISTLTEEKIELLKKDGTISGGMIPKVDACLEAIDGGVEKAHIIDGRVEHSLLLEIFTSEGIGTQVLGG
ncbi:MULTISPECIES: acetylglutamate kinase [unclassified Nitratiruptor]|uniref:acetylglutamate kinase n=1 Tax=unclassified Nitratiruptor TaxID=2624044 RepID=UPI0019168652|nr:MULTISPECIES: acetylglutamate kinase [unclassified Nitratiruptor]BCD60242.1 acetylglutamate kinase [Nitratiruptor sp. YY08-10]BCD64269.1 acetylglutamate kinase [Nitratiruptor sp. YY08-14]